MNLLNVVERLQTENEVSFTAHGNSMTGKINHGDVVTVQRLKGAVKKGDVVLAKVRGRWYLHLVSATRTGEVRISNNKGYVNGWTSKDNVVGKVLDRHQ